ncbi:MAG TPA: hypothetical protein VMF11_10560 [Candidatus Baltobacteraceae bacterium]|nr:hypothetical protein [Candidatus Baltobacteraceae bacterium]
MRCASRLPFLIAVALIGAAVGDPLVETIANTGILGPGYADNVHSSVVPTLIAGISLALLLLGWQCRRLLSCRSRSPQRPGDLARRFLARSPIRDVPYVVILQLAAVFVMESCEQAFCEGGLLGGTAWLGGPVLFSLFVHASIATLFTILIARAMRAIVRRCAVLVEIVFDRILGAFGRENTTIFARRDDASRRCRTQVLHVRQLGERAPPLLIPLT